VQYNIHARGGCSAPTISGESIARAITELRSLAIPEASPDVNLAVPTVVRRDCLDSLQVEFWARAIAALPKLIDSRLFGPHVKAG
jgi:hypothetical protein